MSKRREEVWAVAVSRDGRWVVTAGDVDRGVLKDVSVDITLLARRAHDFTARIWTQANSWLVRSRAWVW